MDWTRILAYITGSVDQELLLRNEYLPAENRILRAQLNGCLRLSDAERATLGEIGFRLRRKALSEVAIVAQPDTILAWHRRLIARKFEGSRARRVRGRPRIDREVEGLIIHMAEENRSWGYDRIVGALANLGHEVYEETGRHGTRRKLAVVPRGRLGVVSELDHQGFFWRRHWRRSQAASARGVSLASKPSFASWLMRRLALTSFERRSK